ncbi:hypothetical protein EFP_086 [Enterococcus phage EF24C]|jgi:hypothetical protein|uniref:Uncharacterized protein n=3 Tax=Kochikohdavirus TaxID=2560160 RepID=A8E2D8_BPPHE|nr:hypothetical protein EFP_gp086 [Enterococcus phage EF24C]UQT00531.1 hypothetical protein FGBNBECL_00180 [Enterococcus phage vB_OCPT_Bob]USL84367.1 hypothetical protein Sw5_103 [Enterococcus phage Sw5]BAF81354.1 hypothetical protein EFP_086 [Enterococcus phage EF24C]
MEDEVVYLDEFMNFLTDSGINTDDINVVDDRQEG